MARRKRGFTTFNLSFLDIMSCGFGAVVLVFLIIDHSIDVQSEERNADLLAEVSLLDEDVREGRAGLVRLRNTIDEVDLRIVEAQGLDTRIREELEDLEARINELRREDPSQRQDIAALQAELRQLESEVERLRASAREPTGRSAREFTGDGERQYLTGLNLGGRHIAILLDSSASMLADRLVNIIRLRNMPEPVRQRAPKWRRAVETTHWISARFPPGAEYQILAFNTAATPLLPETAGNWLPVSDSAQLGRAIDALEKITPTGGTNLLAAFQAVAAMKPAPDNIYLITDGLPTQGSGTAPAKVSERERMKYFNQALAALPRGIPVNVILAPMEGDPMAASAFWQLAIATRGAFLSPSKDWP